MAIVIAPIDKITLRTIFVNIDNYYLVAWL